MYLWMVQMGKNEVSVRFLVLFLRYSSWFLQVVCNISLYRTPLGNVSAFHHHNNIVGHQLIEKMLIFVELFWRIAMAYEAYWQRDTSRKRLDYFMAKTWGRKWEETWAWQYPLERAFKDWKMTPIPSRSQLLADLFPPNQTRYQTYNKAAFRGLWTSGL